MANSIGKRLKQARTIAGLSQKQLGIAADIDEFSASPRINQYERGKHKPDFATAERLMKVLGVPTPYLYASDDNIAEMILLFGKLPVREKRKLITQMRQLAEKKKR